MKEVKTVDITAQAKAMVAKECPKIHGYRIDAMEKIELVVDMDPDKFTTYLRVTLNEGCNVDTNVADLNAKYVKHINHLHNEPQVSFEVSGASVLAKVMVLFIVPDEMKAKYDKKTKIDLETVLRILEKHPEIKNTIVNELGI